MNDQTPHQMPHQAPLGVTTTPQTLVTPVTHVTPLTLEVAS